MFVPITLVVFLSLSGVSQHCQRELWKKIRLTIELKLSHDSSLMRMQVKGHDPSEERLNENSNSDHC